MLLRTVSRKEIKFWEIMSCGTSAYVSSDVSWNGATREERVKLILADVARQVDRKVVTSFHSETESMSSFTAPSSTIGDFLAQAVGHDPSDHVTSEHCLIGCIFFVAADYLQSFAPSEIESWASSIKRLGGQVEHTYSTQITHVLCSSQFLDAARAAVADVKRVVTAYWLADALKSKKMNPPTRAIHLPCPFMPPAYPLSNLLVSVTGFFGADRIDARLLLAAVGAIYTPHLTPRHTVLIAGKASGSKYECAIKWGIPVVNATWLKDIYFGNMSALKIPVAQQYLVRPNTDESCLTLRLEPSDLARVGHLFSAWKHYLKVPREALKKRLSEVHTPDERNRPASGLDHSVVSNSDRTKTPSSSPHVIITGFSAKASFDLARKVRLLGGHVLEAISSNCSHLIAPAIVLTPKFLASFHNCRYIVAPEWVEASYIANNFLPESGFQLRDPVNERLYKFNLLFAHEKINGPNIFEGLSFYISPSIQPRPSVIRMIILNYGGTVLPNPPPAAALVCAQSPPPPKISQSEAPDTSVNSGSTSSSPPQLKICDAMEETAEHTNSSEHGNGRPESVVIAHPQDTPLFRDLYSPHVPIHSVEFVLTACLRQELNFSDFLLSR